MPSSARALAAGVAAALLLTAAPSASADEVRYVYNGLFAASVSYATEEASESGQVTRRIVVDFTTAGFFDDLRFVGGKLISQRQVSNPDPLLARSQLTFINRDVDPAETTICTDGASRVTAPGLLNPLHAFDPSLPGRAIGLTPFSLALIDLNCGIGGLPLGIGAVSHRPGDLGPGHLRAELLVPREQLGDEEILLRYDRQWGDLRTCPGDFVESDLRTCSTRLRGTLRLTRTYADPSEPDDDLLAPPPPSRPRLDRGARRARSTVRCPRGCRYDIRVFMPPRGGRGRLGKSAAAPRPIARAAGRLPASRAARTVSVTIPPAQRAAVRALGGAVVRVSLDPPSGRTVLTTGFATAPR